MQTIKRWSLNDHKLLTIKAKLDDFDENLIHKKTAERIGFRHTDTTVSIPTFFYRINGVIGEEDTFYDRIFNLDEKLKRHGKLYVRVEKGFDRRVDNDTIDKIQKEWQRLEVRGPIDPQNIVRAVELADCLKRFTDKKHHSLVLNSLRLFFEDYFQLNSSIKNHEIKNILIHIVHWVNKYVELFLRDFDFASINPKVLYYGPINKREGYFLLFLSRLGCDIITINTESDAPFDKIDPNNTLSQCANAMRQLPLRPFPTERISSAMQTQAFAASEELREHLHSDDSMFYRPWQLVDYSVRAMRLISTYDEIGILAKEQAVMRHGWEVEHGTVTIPSFFSKVIGVRKDHNQYYHEINNLKKLPKTHFYDSLPLCKKVTKLLKVEYYSVCGKDGQVDTNQLINAGFWPYKHLQQHVQKLIAAAVRDFCAFKGIKRQKKYGVDEQRLIIFTTLMSVDNEALQLLQLFDYPREVPKCIIYNNEDNGELIFEDSILIYFYSSVGMDVIVYNPAGHNDIEIYIDDSMFNKHHLEEIAFNLPFKTFAVFGKYIK